MIAKYFSVPIIILCFSVLLSCAPTLSPAPSSTSALVPSLDDFWAGRAVFEVDVAVTGLPLGESDTVQMASGELWSYFHASNDSAGVHDQCGEKVDFPGCVVIYRSQDAGHSFAPIQTRNGAPICQIPCLRCPCTPQEHNIQPHLQYDHIRQQQYPRIARTTDASGQTHWIMVYEYLAYTMLRRSEDGLNWSPAEQVALTGIWRDWLAPCRPVERIGPHPNQSNEFDCLTGSPPGILIEGKDLYLFVGMGQNPGSMGCYKGPVSTPASLLRKCDQTPLFTGAKEYGPIDRVDTSANAYFDFRTISSADGIKVGDRYYLFYEGVRGPDPKAPGDTQFGLGLARSTTSQIDGPWETFSHNPILLDLPGNVGVGHADVIVLDGITYLYTSLDNQTRSRLVLVWRK